MRHFFILLSTLLLASCSGKDEIYNYSVTDNHGQEVQLSQYRGKVLLIVNTATHCGFTPQYNDLDSLYDWYAVKGLEILDFPCNQFAEQAPGTDEEIHQFCTVNYNTQFARFHKIDVNGEAADPLYTFLKSKRAVGGYEPQQADADFAEKTDIKWNFTKFLVDREGCVVARFEPNATKDTLAPAIEALLK